VRTAAKAALLWLAILGFAVANGALREAWLVSWLGRSRATMASGVVLAIGILAITTATIRWYGRLPGRRYWAIGLAWVVATVMFETALGRLVEHRPWHELLDAYRFRGGNLWPIDLAVTLAAPWCAARIRR